MYTKKNLSQLTSHTVFEILFFTAVPYFSFFIVHIAFLNESCGFLRKFPKSKKAIVINYEFQNAVCYVLGHRQETELLQRLLTLHGLHVITTLLK
jgi:hypothetical protein